MESAITALSTSMTTIGESCADVVEKAIPIALPIIGTMIVVSIGIKVFKKLTGKA